MPSTINKQPVFTSIPILSTGTYDVARFTSDMWAPGNVQPTSVFAATDDNGTLIERITVSTCGDLTNTIISEKFVYLFIYNNISGYWNLYKSAYVPTITIHTTTLNHEIEWVFAGGLLMPQNYQIGFGASDNWANSARLGDYLSITIEGSSYTAL